MRAFNPVTLLFLAAAAVAQQDGSNPFKVPVGGYSGSAGQSLALNWTPTSQGTVSLILREGNSQNLQEGIVITNGAQNSGSYTWTIPSDIVMGTQYAIEIVDDSDPNNMNYSPFFTIFSPITSSSALPTVTSFTVASSLTTLSTVKPSTTPASITAMMNSTMSSHSSTASKTSMSMSMATTSAAGSKPTSSASSSSGAAATAFALPAAYLLGGLGAVMAAF